MSFPARTRRTTVVATALAAAGAGVVLTLAPPAGADQTLRLTTSNPQNTDLDLGEPGPSAGDAQVFLDEVHRSGRLVGSSAGVCTLTAMSETRIVVSCATTLTFTDGSTLTTHGVSDENPQVGPTSFRWAVTGGTGRYRGAAGEVVGTFVPNSDNVELVIRLR
jgi:hypothetical protein